MTKPKVVLVAEDAAGLQTLRLLERRGWHIDAVLTASRERRAGATVAEAARRSGISVLAPQVAAEADFADVVRARGVDLLLNVHSLVVIDRAVVATPRVGSFNLHPGPLPEYAGLNVPSWAILNGERRHAVTLHWMTERVDAGPIAWSRRFPINRSDTGISLFIRCVRMGLPLIERLLLCVERGTRIPKRAQELGEQQFFGARPPNEGRVSWSDRARRISDLVRASDYRPFTSPWGHPTTARAGRSIGIVEASPTRRSSSAPPGTVTGGRDRSVLVATADRWLAVGRVHHEGHYRDAADVLRADDVLH